MTTGTVTFYKMKGSLSSGEYPLLTTGQNLTSFQVHSATVKYAKGLQTRIVMPTFTNWETANIAYLDGQFYWITASKESTTYNGSIEFVLDYMGPTSFFRTTDTAKGSWHKLPTNACKYLKDSITNDIMTEVSATYPDNITVGYSVKYDTPTLLSYNVRCFWMHIVGYDTSGNLKKWGGFLGYDVMNHRFIFGGIDFKPISGSTQYVYPSFYELLKNINRYTGIDATQVLDISISTRCPYKVEKTDHYNSLLHYTYSEFRLYDYTGTAIDPTEVYTDSGYHYALYDLMGSPFLSQSQTITITPTDMQRALGEILIKDWNNNAIMTIPTRASNSIAFEVVDDISGIYTMISTQDQKISIPEGKLPYLSNSWEQYKAFQMDTDRMSMENAIKYARYERETTQISGMANATINAVNTGVMGGFVSGSGPIGVGMGIASGIAGSVVSWYEQERAYELQTMKARDSFNLTKKQARLEPQTAYNVAYGSIYCDLNEQSPLRASISMPENVDSTYYDAWVAEYGYPVEGVFSATISNGYYQGSLISDADTKSGMYWDECNKAFMNGFKFITP